jgi:hypothetical protein
MALLMVLTAVPALAQACANDICTGGSSGVVQEFEQDDGSGSQQGVTQLGGSGGGDISLGGGSGGSSGGSGNVSNQQGVTQSGGGGGDISLGGGGADLD